ncbi:Uncharacterised protein [Serratia quinivorans]|uniref:hypothetical protein n=1 Tax=Serratia quinivorans TaxID=137545 RepID=UPI0021780A9A|nr:hypothetical protein [Serratia quinivorans]CAI1905714.1 Uncharacterised protein [Serratia quinivorans]
MMTINISSTGNPALHFYSMNSNNQISPSDEIEMHKILPSHEMETHTIWPSNEEFLDYLRSNNITDPKEILNAMMIKFRGSTLSQLSTRSIELFTTLSASCDPADQKLLKESFTPVFGMISNLQAMMTSWMNQIMLGNIESPIELDE